MYPLEDPDYDPVCKPQNGVPPYVVAKWGPRSQKRWFDRFRDELHPQRAGFWDRFYCSSVQHTGNCCISCIGEEYDGYRDWDPDMCCCQAIDQGFTGSLPPARIS